MFPAYRVQDRKSEKALRLGGWSYLWAGLFGVFYLLLKGGLNKLLPGTLVTLICFGAVIGFPFFTARFVPGSLHSVALILVIPAIFVVQSFRTSALIRDSFKQRGWRVRRED
jgi:hypothetical protein